MPKLPALTSKQIISLLKQHGFQLDRSSGSHFVYLHPISKRRVIVPLHNRDIAKGTLLSILNQAGLEKDDLFAT